MTIVHCPRCRDEVTVPPSAGGRALVRCPLCLEEYLLAEALANAPPPLVVIGGEVPQAALPAIEEGQEYHLAPGALAAAPVASAPVAMPRPLPRFVRQRPKTNPAFLIANYVGGGIAGLALGMAVLWWGFRRDPLGAGPAVAAYAPWIVPAEFRGPASKSEAPASSLVVQPDRSERESPPAETAKRRRARAPAGDPPASQPAQEPLQTLPALDDARPASSQPPAIEPPALNTLEPSAPSIPIQSKGGLEPGAIDLAGHTRDSAPHEGAASTAAPPLPDLTDLLPQDWPLAVVAPPRRTPLISAAEAGEAVQAASAALARYDQVAPAAADARAEALAEFHAAAGEVGRLLSYREPDDAELAEATSDFGDLLERLGKQSSLHAGLEVLTADRWSDLPDGYGLLAIGRVKSIGVAGDRHEIVLQSEGAQAATLRVVAASDPANVCKPGDRLLAAGRAVEDPRRNLPGYEGQQPKVLAAGFLLVVPGAQ